MIVLYLLLTAHLVADFMQPSSLVKLSKENSLGLTVHSGIYCFLSALALFRYTNLWWLWALFLGCLHFFIDVNKYTIVKKTTIGSLYLFLVDQALHLTVIFAVFYGVNLYSDLDFFGLRARELSYLVGYIIVTFAGSILVYEAYNTYLSKRAIVKVNLALTFSDRYMGMTERALILTFLLFGRYFLVPLAFLLSLPVRIKEWRKGARTWLVLELLINFFLALAVGIWLRSG